MIVNLTAEDREHLKALEADYDRRIKETEELIKKLRPEKDFDKKKIKELQRKAPKVPKPIGKSDDGSPVYEEEAFQTWKAETEKINDEINKIHEEWLASGSQEWREARTTLSRLIVEKSDAFNSYYRQVERREFSKLGGDREKIIQSAKEQIVLLIDNRFEHYQKIIETHKNEDGQEISAFSAYDLRVDGADIYLDVERIIDDCKRSLLKLHFEALSQDQEATKELEALLFTIVTDSPKTSSDKGTLRETITFKKKRKPRSAKKLPIYSDVEEQDFFIFPTTQANDIILNLLSNDGDVTKAAQIINIVSKGKKAKVFKGKDVRAIRVETDNTITTIEILKSASFKSDVPDSASFESDSSDSDSFDLDSQKISGRTAKKIFLFIENELYQRVYYKGDMNSDEVTFPLQKLVDKKVYTSAQNARRAFEEAGSVLTCIRMSASLKSRKKDIATGGSGRVMLFPTMKVLNGQCLVRLSKDINWSPLLKDFFSMPDSWWALPDNASDLEYKIFRSARMNKKEINRDGVLTFNVSLSSVATWLNLPLNTKNPKRDVKTPIEKAVKQIAESLDPNNFKIKIETDLNASLTQYLTGYLEVTISGAYTQNLFDMNEKQQARVDRANRRKDAIIKEATIRKIADQMKEADQAEQKKAT